tara:strand:+ start:246 stop:428 length:183 start_codon:yes stop_codon:yes gene_type:complete
MTEHKDFQLIVIGAGTGGNGVAPMTAAAVRLEVEDRRRRLKSFDQQIAGRIDANMECRYG